MLPAGMHECGISMAKNSQLSCAILLASHFSWVVLTTLAAFIAQNRGLTSMASKRAGCAGVKEWQRLWSVALCGRIAHNHVFAMSPGVARRLLVLGVSWEHMACQAIRISSRSPPTSPRTDGTGTHQSCDLNISVQVPVFTDHNHCQPEIQSKCCEICIM